MKLELDSNNKFKIFEDIVKEMQKVYLHDDRPWMIGFSGGKDSTLLCCLLFEMLKKLSGKTHSVVTSIVVIDSQTGEYKKDSTTSYVTFENLTDEKIHYYIDNFKPFDKAGSYGIQEMPEGYIKSYEGDFENIMGMSSKSLINLLNLKSL